MQKNTIIDGIAASEHLDSSGESLDIKGMDISSLGGPDSILNWEHGSKDRPSQVVGKVTFAKKILKESDAKNKREKYYWNKLKKPFVYIKAELFDGVGHSGAQDIAAMLRYKNKDKGEDSRLVVGFSIEGGKIEKKGMVVKKSIARDVAITVKPCNKVCDAEVVETDNSEDFLYKNQSFDCEVLEKGFSFEKTITYRDLIIADIKKNDTTTSEFKEMANNQINSKSFKEKGKAAEKIANEASKHLNKQPEARPKRQFLPDKNPKKIASFSHKGKKSGPPNWNSVYKTENNMRKALIAGFAGGSPDSKTGMAALSKEDLDKKKLKKNQPRFGFKNVGVENRSDMDVKTVDPRKTYQLKSGKKVSQQDFERKKIANDFLQESKREDGVKNMNEYTKDSQRGLKAQGKREAKQLDIRGTAGQNYSDPESKINRSYVSKESRSKAQRGNYPNVREHEGVHHIVGNFSQKYSQEHGNSVINRILKENFRPETLESINNYIVSQGYDESHPRHNEEKLAHIQDLLTNVDTRNIYEQNKELGSVDYKGLKRGWRNATKRANSLTDKEIKNIHDEETGVKAKQPKIQRVAPGKSGLK